MTEFGVPALAGLYNSEVRLKAELQTIEALGTLRLEVS
jgi:hypothetical protein